MTPSKKQMKKKHRHSLKDKNTVFSADTWNLNEMKIRGKCDCGKIIRLKAIIFKK